MSSEFWSIPFFLPPCRGKWLENPAGLRQWPALAVDVQPPHCWMWWKFCDSDAKSIEELQTCIELWGLRREMHSCKWMHMVWWCMNGITYGSNGLNHPFLESLCGWLIVGRERERVRVAVTINQGRSRTFFFFSGGTIEINWLIGT